MRPSLSTALDGPSWKSQPFAWLPVAKKGTSPKLCPPRYQLMSSARSPMPSGRVHRTALSLRGDDRHVGMVSAMVAFHVPVTSGLGNQRWQRHHRRAISPTLTNASPRAEGGRDVLRHLNVIGAMRRTAFCHNGLEKANPITGRFRAILTLAGPAEAGLTHCLAASCRPGEHQRSAPGTTGPWRPTQHRPR